MLPKTSRAHRLLAAAVLHHVRGAALALSWCWVAASCASGSAGASGETTPRERNLEEQPSVAAEEETEQGPPPAASPSEAAPSKAVPEACASGSGDCAPPQPWVKDLCNGVYAEVALVMFRGGTPWQRLYLRGKTRAVNASGGATVEGSLTRDEEVLVLRHRKSDAGGMQIGDGSGQYDVLRWNGSCVSLEAGEVTKRAPGSPGQARIEWRWLGEGMRAALRRDEAVSQAFLARKKECRGATSGAVTKACERLDLKLIERIAAHVRSGPELPAPEEQP